MIVEGVSHELRNPKALSLNFEDMNLEILVGLVILYFIIKELKKIN